jgi:putative FmdB family regulatory protein
MPTYDYKNLECSDCPQYIEIYHDFNDTKEKIVCEKCGKEVKVQKTYGVPKIHFKGSGFYVNDNKKADEGMKKYYPRDPNKKKYY